jgi:UDP-N-acetylglucosamine 2-epimerase (non-hydrolysing)
MTIMLIAGARPNFMKVAPVLEELRKRAREIEVLLVHTGQHYGQMSDTFFGDLNLPQPDVNLGAGSGTHAQQTARIMVAFEELCLEKQPNWAVVVGDVNSTVACAITAKKLGISVAHVEAGLRSYDLSMPEEINRLCTDAISDILFTTDELASENLRREGIAEARIHFVGNTMIDTLLRHIDRARSLPLPELVTRGQYAVLTLHRPSNVDGATALEGICSAVLDIGRLIPVVFPVHPRTRARLEQFGLLQSLEDHGAIHLLEPLGYLRFLGLVAQSRMVLTDSGGIQEETTVLGIPCITMRPNTERPITCEVGTNILVGTSPDAIRAAAIAVLERGVRRSSIPKKWDGLAATRIVDTLLSAAGDTVSASLPQISYRKADNPK